MFSVGLPDRLLLLEVEADDGLVRLFYGFLLLHALQMLLLVLRDLLCVDINAVSVLSCVSLGGRGRVSVPSSRDAVARGVTMACRRDRRGPTPSTQYTQFAGRGRRAFEVLRQFLRPLIQRIIISQILVHRVPRVVQLRFEFLAVGFRFRGFRLQGFLLTSPGF